MDRKSITKTGRFVLAAALAAGLAACARPSEQYGLAPVARSNDAYPNINQDPAQKPTEKTMSPEERAAAEAELMREAGKLPKR
jgi:type IV pilus biogenesis protein CpaD/CtpE